MTSIFVQKQGKYSYLTESESVWNKEKQRCDNTQRHIGKIDLVTGETVYKQEYIDRLAGEGKDVSAMAIWDRTQEVRGKKNTTSPAQVLETVKRHGTVHLLRNIAVNVGLTNILNKVFDEKMTDILAMACYLVSEGKALMYANDWQEENYGFEGIDLSSQRTSDILSRITDQQRNDFYRLWCAYIRENEYVAMDITSVSSYSSFIDEVSWGHNRDGENLPQVNICLLYGETSRLPVYYTTYEGSLNDVSTLRSTIQELITVTGQTEIKLVNDKGFFSEKNIKELMDFACQFLMPVSLTSQFAKEAIDAERETINSPSNIIRTASYPVRGVHRLLTFGNISKKIHTHIFFNPVKATYRMNDLHEYVAGLKQEALKNRKNKKSGASFKKYLIIRKASKREDGCIVGIKEAVVENELRYAGWLVIVSNVETDSQHCLDVYRMKDVTEKGHWRLKNALGLDRLRVHGSQRMQNKVFINFIALILIAHIDRVMSDSKLYESFTMQGMLLELGKLKCASINGQLFLKPVTKTQKQIFEAFEITPPGEIAKEKKKQGRPSKKR